MEILSIRSLLFPDTLKTASVANFMGLKEMISIFPKFVTFQTPSQLQGSRSIQLELTKSLRKHL